VALTKFSVNLGMVPLLSKTSFRFLQTSKQASRIFYHPEPLAWLQSCGTVFQMTLHVLHHWQCFSKNWKHLFRQSYLGMSEFCDSARAEVCTEVADVRRIGHCAQNSQSGTEIVEFCRFCSAI